MIKMEIFTGEDNPVLRAKSVSVEKFDGGLKKFVKSMKEKMVETKGLGIAAPQVGENLRICVVLLNYDTPNEVVVPMVNPEILGHGEEITVAEEGCLSLPGCYANVERWERVMVEYCDLKGEKRVLSLEGLNARVVQHEIDHLDGVLFVDRVEKKKGVRNPF